MKSYILLLIIVTMMHLKWFDAIHRWVPLIVLV